ncbi:MAG TPA: 16S rRNA (cytidine(1402)-2'-O)-methyltransferase [Acidimicrobiales bacterium]|nr:16S rRNA (cytidine(1402)-2'-O)-methyltransferase [Acidimicrobiales bacterium]
MSPRRTGRPPERARPSEGGAAGAGVLVLVATPIGNLGDLSRRAVEVLETADAVLCEDTRRTRALLSAAGVPGRGRLISLHEHNEAQRSGDVVARLAAGQTVAVVSDAGTPAVSDPGARVVAAAVAAGYVVTVVPGPSAALAALVVSGLPTDRFCVEGFVARRGAERTRRLAALAAEPRTTVLFEAPGRLAATLADLARVCGEGRPVAVARELTKVHEEVWRGTLGEAAAEFSGRDVRGEVVVVLGGAAEAPPASARDVSEAVAHQLAAGVRPAEAAANVAAALGVPRRRAYDAALALRPDRD